jgi:hypothetical protein
MLKFGDREYRTIADIRERFPISEKKLKKMIKDGVLPAPKEIRHGTRTFRYYPDEWEAKLAELVDPRPADGGTNG